jgi:hypothetical protein
MSSGLINDTDVEQVEVFRSKKENKHLFGIFVDEATYWWLRFGLTDYELFFGETSDKDDRANCITYSTNEERIARINVCLSHPFTHRELCKVAFHEICELLVRDLYNIASEHIHRSYITTETHRIIRRLESGVFCPDYTRRIQRGEKSYASQTSRTILAARG